MDKLRAMQTFVAIVDNGTLSKAAAALGSSLPSTVRTLATLAQPFTTSEARQALGTTRRVVIPLLEHLDTRGWTRRVDTTHREVVRS